MTELVLLQRELHHQEERGVADPIDPALCPHHNVDHRGSNDKSAQYVLQRLQNDDRQYPHGIAS